MDLRRVSLDVDSALRMAVIVLAGFYLSPLLRIGYISDDAIRSLMPGVLKVEGFTLPGYIGAECMAMLRASRVFPLQVVGTCSWFMVTSEPRIHRMMVLAGVLLNLWLFSLLVRRVSRSGPFSLFATCLVIPLFQFRTGFDPILAFFGIFQIIVAGLFASLLALQVYLDTNKLRYILFAILSYFCILEYYELVYPLFLLHVALVALDRRPLRAKLMASLPFVAAGAFGFLSTIVARLVFLSSAAMAEQSRINLDPVAYLVTLCRQTWCAFPLSYFLVDHARFLPSLKHPAQVFAFAATPGGLAIAAAAFAICLLSLPRIRPEPEDRAAGRTRRVALLGGLLSVLPAVLVAMSVRHQMMIVPGIGYTPVYVQYFGVALLLAESGWALLSIVPGSGRRRFLARAAVALCIAATAGLTFRANSVLMDKLELPLVSPGFNPIIGGVFGQWNYHRRNLESALRAGLLDGVQDHADVHLTHEYFGWHNHVHSKYFYATYGNKVVNAILPPSGPMSVQNFFVAKDSLREPRPESRGPSFILNDVCLGKDSGYVLLAPGGDAGGRSHAGGRGDEESRLFIRHPTVLRSGGVGGLLLVGRSPADGAGTAVRRHVRRADELKVVRSGRDWVMVSLTGEMACIDPKSLVVVFNEVAGSWDEEHYATRIRGVQSWARDDRKTLCLTNATKDPRRVKVSMRLMSKDRDSLIIDAGASCTRVDVGPETTRLERKLTLAPGMNLLEIRAPGVTETPAAEGPRTPCFFATNLSIQDLSSTRK